MLLSVSAPLLLCSCTVFSSAENLLEPPALSEEQAAVYKALRKQTGNNINLVFPSSGAIRSAYLFDDLDGDGSDEAAVFYRMSGEEDSVRINLLDRNESGSWRSVYDLSGKGNRIDEVRAETIGDSGRKYLCVGYDADAENDILEIYSYDKGRLQTVFSDVCERYFITDINGDGKNELAAAALASEGSLPKAYIASETESGSIKEFSAAELTGSAKEIRNITVGHVAENTPALFIDEAFQDGTLSTEIIYSVSGMLRNPSSAEKSTVTADTKRIAGYYSSDCDFDGITEIPVTETAPGYENRTEKLYITKWCVLQNFEITEKYTGWYSTSDGYSFMFPERWKGQITVKTDANTGAAVFCRYDGSVETSRELMRVLLCEKTDADFYLNSGWKLIAEKENADFLARFSEDANEPLVLTSSEVKDNFYVY